MTNKGCGRGAPDISAIQSSEDENATELVGRDTQAIGTELGSSKAPF